MNQLADIQTQDEKLLGCSADQIIHQLPNRLSHSVLRWAETAPNQAALVGDRESLTYLQLSQHVTSYRTKLQSLGVRGGDRVMLVSENGLSLVCLVLALSELDAIAVVINARLSDREIDLIRADCEPRRIVYTSPDSADAAAHAKRMAAVTEPFPLGELQVSALAEVEPEVVHENPVDQVLAMIYTTGTTGTPKGVMLTHRNLTFIAYVSARLRGVEFGDKVYCVLPMSHVFGLSAVSLSVLSMGGCVYLFPRFDAASVLHGLQNEGIAGFLGVPTMYALMLECFPETFQAPKLKFMYSGGSPLDPDLKKRVEDNFGLTLSNGYGLTETGPTICQTRLYAPMKNTSVGYCLPGVQIQIRRPDGSVIPAGEGEIGELWVSGPNVMKGYFRKDEATAAVMSEGWFNTEDLVFEDEFGAINIAGRAKELIIRSGFNIYPPEVETVVAAHPDVSLCAVIGRTIEGNEEVYAFVQPVAGTVIDKSSLLVFIREQLSGYKVPSEIIFMDNLPVASSGKILKHQLKVFLPK